MRSSSPLPLRIVTHNIRYATDAPFKGEELWPVRRPLLLNELCFNTRHCPAAFICLQEVLHEQLLDIHQGLNGHSREWSYVGVGRDDGKNQGEYSPIFYRPGIWHLQTWRTVWLSETPEKPSKGWDAASIRILTIAVFLHRDTGKQVLALNTHLDDQGQISRYESARIIQEQIRLHADQGINQPCLPVFLAGDFNSEPTQEAYLEMTKEGSPMVDLRETVPSLGLYGDSNTFTGFDPEDTIPDRIDFIFLNSKDPNDEDRTASSSGQESCQSMSRWWKAVAYAVLPNRFEDGIFNSDHRAVVGDLLLA